MIKYFGEKGRNALTIRISGQKGVQKRRKGKEEEKRPCEISRGEG